MTEEQSLAHQYSDLGQQTESYNVGMWTFLVTEIMFFGALFFAYTVYRNTYYDVFNYVSGTLNTRLGFVNTLILLTSSLTMAMAVQAAHLRRRMSQIYWLFATMALSFGFLGVKYIEYSTKYRENHIPGAFFHIEGQNLAFDQKAQLYFSIYFGMTGLHGIHVIIGILMMAVFIVMLWKKHHNVTNEFMYLEMGGLYWHFVDIVWIFLYPLLYLMHPSKVF